MGTPMNGKYRFASRWSLLTAAFAGFALIGLLVIGSSSAWAIKPGHYPSQLNPKNLKIRGGDPAPDKPTWDDTANSCSPGGGPGGARVGTYDMQQYIDYWFIGTSSGIYNCRNRRGGSTLSIHAEGRALDWALDYYNDNQRAAAFKIRDFFLTGDKEGYPRAGARRFGVQAIIFAGHHFQASQVGTSHARNAGGTKSNGWWHSCGSCGHYDHMHIEQDWAGAQRNTTAWTGYQEHDRMGPDKCDDLAYAATHPEECILPDPGAADSLD